MVKRFALMAVVVGMTVVGMTTGVANEASLLVSAAAPPAISISSSEQLASEVAAAARGHGWTIAEAEARNRTADIIGAIANQIATERPKIFIGSALSIDPRGAPTLYIKGPADDFVTDLVDASGIEIVVADNQPFSFDELIAREMRAHQALRAQGFRAIVTEVDIRGRGRIPAAVTAAPGLPTRVADIVGALPADLRSHVDLTISTEVVAEDTVSFGGMRVTKDGGVWATSGFTVSRVADPNDEGVTTAGHAVGANGIVHPGEGTHSFVFAATHQGAYGDIRWHRTNQAEWDDYYSTATTVADVVSVEPWSAMSIGEGVCFYGRSSNDQDCTLDIAATSISCTDPDTGLTASRLVKMNAVTTVGGDSGGPWFSAGRAYGSEKGHCSQPNGVLGDAFSVADLFDEALGVSVDTTQ